MPSSRQLTLVYFIVRHHTRQEDNLQKVVISAVWMRNCRQFEEEGEPDDFLGGQGRGS